MKFKDKMFQKRSCLFFLILLLYSWGSVSSSSITTNNNAYQGIVIAINPQVNYDSGLIARIQEIWTEASRLLFQITNQRIYFGSIKILVPKTWNQESFTPAINETYDLADVLIANPNPLFHHQPYVVQNGRCGLPGSYIHITPEFLMNSEIVQDFGDKHKAIIHEWAHYRWGVFDEYPSDDSSAFYFNRNGGIEATKCPQSLQGVHRYVDSETGIGRECRQNFRTGLPEIGCRFVPFVNQPQGLNVSLLSFQFLSQVTSFCHSNSNDQINQHNIEAPTEQNRLCNLRSVWDVILDSPDFANGANPSVSTTIDPIPVFSVIQAVSYRRHVLVLDTSGSMSGDRLELMRQAVSIFISQFVPDEDEVAVVEFSSSATELSGLRKMTSTRNREILLNSIPTVAAGSTCIGCGIQTALNILERDAGSASAGSIIVFTDGEENTSPYVQDIRDIALQKRAIIHAIFFLTQDNSALQSLATDSGGIWRQFVDTLNSTAINEIFGELAAKKEGDVFNEDFRVHSTSVTVSQFVPYTGSVQIDKDLGKNTIFIFTWTTNPIQIILESPSKCYYSTHSIANMCPGHTSPIIDNRFKTITFTISGVAEKGIWKYHLSTSSLFSQKITATVTSKAASQNASPVVVRFGVDKPNAGLGEPIVVFAQVSQNFAPILGATVLANIESPLGVKKQIQLLDGGSAPDVRKNDGIYTRYFVGYDRSGRYSIQVVVTNEETGGGGSNVKNINPASKANLNVAVANSDGTIIFNPRVKQYTKTLKDTPKPGNFSRILSGSGFEYTGPPVTPDTDNFPPSKITDLVASLVNDNITNAIKIQLTFSAPGSDYDSGKAAFYELRYAVENLTSLLQDFSSNAMIHNFNLTTGNLSSPKEAGSTETFIFDAPSPNKTEKVFLGFSIRAFDGAGNFASPSNVAPITYLIEYPEIDATGDGYNLRASINLFIMLILAVAIVIM